jgi:AraC-like DNA-binding protein
MVNDIDFADIELDYINHRQCTPQWYGPPLKLHFIDLSYIIRGKATYKVDGVPYEVSAGDLLCIPKGSTREPRTDPDDLMECYCLNFMLKDSRTGADVVLPFDIVTHIGERTTLVRLWNLIFQSWLLKERGYALQTKGYAMLILSEVFSIITYDHQLTNADARVRKVVSYVTEHMRSQLSVTHLAEMVQLNPVYFCSLFRKSMGTSVNQFIRRIRVNRAEMLLEEGVLNVTEVADMCGFNDVYYFSRLFKSLKGIPPSAVAKGGRTK